MRLRVTLTSSKATRIKVEAPQETEDITRQKGSIQLRRLKSRKINSTIHQEAPLSMSSMKSIEPRPRDRPLKLLQNMKPADINFKPQIIHQWSQPTANGNKRNNNSKSWLKKSSIIAGGLTIEWPRRLAKRKMNMLMMLPLSKACRLLEQKWMTKCRLLAMLLIRNTRHALVTSRTPDELVYFYPSCAKLLVHHFSKPSEQYQKLF